MKLPNTSRRTFAYDKASRLTTQIELNASGSPILTMVDTYENVGNRKQRVKDGVTTRWEYDLAYRLTTQTATGAAVTMSYDSRGNVKSKGQQGTSPMALTVDAANQLVTMLQGTNTTTYTFDNNGNMVSEQNKWSAPRK